MKKDIVFTAKDAAIAYGAAAGFIVFGLTCDLAYEKIKAKIARKRLIKDLEIMDKGLEELLEKYEKEEEEA